MSTPEEDFPGHLLHQAALWDNSELLLDLLAGDLISHLNCQGRTPLHACSNTDDSHCLKILIKAGANPNIASGAQDNFKTCLHLACEHGCFENIKYLIEHGADAFLLEGHGYSSMDIAERGGHTACYEFLKRAANAKEEARENLHYALREAATASGSKIDAVKNFIKDLGPNEISMIVNMTPNGLNTLLFKACEIGNKGLVEILLENGADGRSHPVTKYSPLYISCYYGHIEIVNILLKKFPLLVQLPTVEKWLPIHASSINGHVLNLDTLLKYDYPSDLMTTFRYFTGDLEYDMPFDINMKDVSGQTALYIAVQMSNQRLVETLLKYRVVGRKIGEKPIKVQSPLKTSMSMSEEDKEETSPSKRRLSEGIQGILTKLSNLTNQNLVPASGYNRNKQENLICPVDVNIYCEEYQTALHVAVKNRNHVIATMLLNSKADANLPILPSINNSSNSYEMHGQSQREKSEDTSSSSTALIEACKQRDLGMIELLLKHGARDDDCRALFCIDKDQIIVGKILALKAHHDAENKINLNFLNENILKRLKKQLLASSILPSSAVTINWHKQKLERISEQYLISAALKINPRLRLCPKNQYLGLHAITRLDISMNNLETIPTIIFGLCSLKYLNISKNKIENLEFPEIISSPWLEEILLNENRLDCIPPELFTHFPSLTIINLSNNKLKKVPSCMWSSDSSIQEIDLSSNLLLDLPGLSVMENSYMFESLPYINPIAEDDSNKNSPESPDFVMVDFDKNRKTDEKQSQSILTHHSLWRQSINIVTNDNTEKNYPEGSKNSSIISLNLSHNGFIKVPKVLPCLGKSIQRLNLSFNNIKQLGYISDYPENIRQLDLSHNQIEKWFNTTESKVGKMNRCFAEIDDECMLYPLSTEPCNHKKHTRLEHLKTLILAGNFMKTIKISGKCETESISEQTESSSSTISTPGKVSNKSSIWFPNITMLDLSENKLCEVTPRVSELTNLSVLNLSMNYDIHDLPPEMGLLTRMWNLNTIQCNLQEPLKSMIESKRCKTMDVIGWLKSVLEDAVPYTRMKLMVVGVQGIGKTSLLQQLRNEGSQQQKQSTPQNHWAKRMNPGAGKNVKASNKTISTVGVDIGSWVLDFKGKSGQTSFGPVTFRTWDFGGQKEYYATHLYFLSRRSLYLVVWNICEGEKGLNEIIQWLVNIQARAPNSPVIIVGTHFDLVSEKFPPGYLDYLQQKIRDKFICISDPEKRGFPKVLYSIEISCKNRHNIRQLANIIYETVFNIKTVNGKRLLEQKIPSKYIYMEEIVTFLANERRARGSDPVISEKEFKIDVSSWLEKCYNLTFRDEAEIMQACSFLHENGVLLHYEDSTLRDLYFLDPQWLCDMLAHVVTVREINPFAKNGIMKVEELRHLFKGQSNETRDYVLSLLSKFELAVPWDETNLLIPSLLPSFDQMKMGQNEVKIKIPVRSRGWALKNRVTRMARHISEDNIKAFSNICLSPTSGSPKINESFEEENLSPKKQSTFNDYYSIQNGKTNPINRFLLMSYFPSGFWPRLISRILSDDRIVEIIRNYFVTPIPSDITPEVVKVLDSECKWCCWTTGMELNYGDLLLLRLKEVTGDKPFSFMLRRDDGLLCETSIEPKEDLEERIEEVWDVVEITETQLLEIHLPAQQISIKSHVLEITPEGTGNSSFKQIILEPAIENLTKLLALIIDHVDTLLEDWFPSIGTRFVHTSEGKYLVTRLIPCPNCFPSSRNLEPSGTDTSPTPLTQHQHRLEILKNPTKSPRMSSDSGVGYSPGNTRVSSVDSAVEMNEESNAPVIRRIGHGLESPKIHFSYGNQSGGGGGNAESSNLTGLNYFLSTSNSGITNFFSRSNNLSMYSWSIEYCILRSQKYADISENAQKVPSQNLSVKCPKHGDILLSEITPDILFLDLNSRYLLDNHLNVHRGNLLGRGSFGFVFGGTLTPKYETKQLEVAIKMFQPICPGTGNSEATIAYKAAKNKWVRAPAQSCCRAYIAARGELRVLFWVSHPNIIPFMGLCQSPLSIVMPRAPRGALDSVLSDFKRSGDRVDKETIRITILQVSKALEYLHSHRIIYRDLKSENALVWEFPQPFSIKEDLQKVDIKISDYGISRSSFPAGSKGFGGTEGYMAPEIIKFNGEEEYTEKVDIFSFGMLLYEMFSLKQPFDGCENVKESILEGIRPSLTERVCETYPLYMLDLMCVCWSHSPKDRPTSSQIVAIATGPEFTFLRDSVSMGNVSNVVAAIGIQYGIEKEIWASCSTGGIYCLKITWTNFESCHCFDFISGVVTAICQVDDNVWMGDTISKIHITRISDYHKIMEYNLEDEVGYCGAVISIQNLEFLIGIAVSSGRLFLCDKTNVKILTELGKSTVIHCLSSRLLPNGFVELWSGEKAGQMSVFKLKDGLVVSQESVNHYEPIIDAVEVLLIDTHVDQDILYSYVYPGSVIYGWNMSDREMFARLDVGKLLPVREAVEEELNHKPLQVTVLRSTVKEIYVGTNWGFVFLAEAKNLRPITSFRPYTEDVRSFWIFRRSAEQNPELADIFNKGKGNLNEGEKGKDNLSTISSSNSLINISKKVQLTDEENSESGNSNDSRATSPSPSIIDKDKESSLVVGIGKGLSNLIHKNLATLERRDKRKRKAFALLWFVYDSWEG